ncbi:hypothetical protein CAAN1_10S00254 [[Candida] anglica]|uniref:DAGKc domain-containing protein n=1 Tax=[Candida] anglica TaxID=148631 RepID=A0ABP0EFE2_9ASCO
MSGNTKQKDEVKAIHSKIKKMPVGDPAAIVVPLYTKNGQLVSVLQTELVLSLVYNEEGADTAVSTTPEIPAPPPPSVPDLTSSAPLHLVENEIIVIDSVNSGKGRNPETDVYKNVIDPLFEELGVEHKHLSTDGADSIKQFANSLKQKKTQLVIFISGDTSINEFINGLDRNDQGGDLLLFHIPAGTGNSLALSLGIYNVAESIQRLLSPEEIVPFNLYEATFPEGSYHLSRDVKTEEIFTPLKFIVVLSWGFHASLVADSDTPELRKHGVQRFAIAAKTNLEEVQLYDGETRIGDNETLIEGPFAYWLATPAKRFEKPFEISPRGDVKDDKLWLVAFNTSSGSEYIVDIMTKVYDSGKHVKDERVVYESVQKGEDIVLEVSAKNSARRGRFCLDGSIIKVPDGKQGTVKVNSTGNNHQGWSFYLIT